MDAHRQVNGSRHLRLAVAITFALVASLVGTLGAQPVGAQTGGPSAPVLTGPTKPHPKLDTQLLQLVEAEGAGDAAATAAAGAVLQTAPGRAMVDVYLRPSYRDPLAFDAATAELRAHGLEVLATRNVDTLPVVEGWIALPAVDGLEQLASTQAVTAVPKAGLDTGTVLSQGDASHNGPAARALGPTGAGITVGIISDSMDSGGGGITASQSSGNLPAQVVVLADDPNGTDEGRAMAEIIYDTAPGITKMLFASGTVSGSVGKANAIDALVANGAKVIADDIFYVSEPFFQDGPVSQAVDRARAAGVAYFASAGNRARQSWEGTYVDAGGLNNFGGGDTRQTLATVPNNGFIQVAMQWDEPWGSTATNLDYDIEISRTDNATPLATSVINNVTTGFPIEIATWQNTTGSSVTVDLRVGKFSGSRNPFMKYIARGNFGSFSIAEHNTASNTINPDAAAATGAVTVAAVAYNDAGLDTPESFSSRGKLTRRFNKDGVRLGSPEVRQKPQIAAADGVATSVAGFNPFFGTSASTPSAAGVAALTWSARPNLTVSQLVAILTNKANTIDCTAANNPDGSDDDCGFGFVLANKTTTEALIRKITVTKPGPGGGTITGGNPTGINCGATCTAGFPKGTVVTLNAVADSVSVFTGWSGGGCSGTGSCVTTLNTDNDVTVSANFETKGAGYHPVTPTRILDSRGPTGGWNAKLTSVTAKDLQVTGLGGPSNVPANASAVVMNVTVTGGSNGSFVSVWPTGRAQPTSSNLNFAPGETIPNLVTVKVGTGGKVAFANAVGDVHVVADVVGYYDDGITVGDLFTGITPTRVLDSRGPTGSWNGKLDAATPRNLVVQQPGNASGVPATATAVVANVTVTGGSHGSFVSVWPSGLSQPNVSNLNFAPGQTIPNLAIVKIGTGGSIRFANAVGTVDVIVDIVGYFDPTGGSKFHAMIPTRVLDDRNGTGLSGSWTQGQSRALSVAGAAGTHVPAGATGLVTNVTATNSSLGSFVTVYPDGVAKPNSSNLNFARGQTIPNLVTVKVPANGKIDLYNELGTVDLIADAVGYYAPT